MTFCAVHPIALGSALRPCDKSDALVSALNKARAVKQQQGFGERTYCIKTSSNRVQRRGESSSWIVLCSRDDRGSCDAAEHRFEEPFREAIFELEIMVREPAEVLGGMQERLSAKDLELVLSYFAQEGRDSWCALEVYEWMQKENRVRDETQKLMMSIMYEWVMKLVEGERSVEEVRSLLQVRIQFCCHIADMVLPEFSSDEAERFAGYVLRGFEAGVSHHSSHHLLIF